MNKRDLEDAAALGKRKGDARFQRAMQKFNRVDTETAIGIALDQIKRAGIEIPAEQAKQLEARYGESTE